MIYILKKDYLTIYGAKYSEALAAALRENSIEVKQIYIEDKITFSDKTMTALRLTEKDTISIELYSDGIFIKNI